MATVLLPTGTEEPISDRLRIYPNPTTDRIIVEVGPGTKAEVNLNLNNVQGQPIYQKRFGTITALLESIPLPNAGTYVLTIQVGQQTYTQKVVRQ